MKAFVVLEDGKVFEGKSFAAPGEVFGEVVLCTDMIGYQEILAEPKSQGKIILMTYTMIGNSGVSEEFFQKSVCAAGIIVKEACKTPSNHTSVATLGDWLNKNGKIGIEGIDTREFTRHIRAKSLKAVLYAGDSFDLEALKAKAKG